MAVANANYKFIIIHVGAYGKDIDGGIFSNSYVHIRLENISLKLLEQRFLPDSNIEVPFVFVGDEDFPLRTYLMGSYPYRQLDDENKKYYNNYILSCSRMIIECAFGIASSKFRILQKKVLKPK